MDVLTQHNDPQRTGANLAEEILNTSNVNTRSFGKLWTLYADGQIVAQPLYLSHLKTPKCPNPGGCNAIIFCTMHNTVYVYDADGKPTTRDNTLFWSRWLGEPRPSGTGIDMWHTNDPEWGILGTPVIDRARGVLYVVSWNALGNKTHPYYLHALDIGTGEDRIQPQEISGYIQVTLEGARRKTVVFHPELQKQRPALLLQDGVLYIGFGAANESKRNFHGWLFAYDAQTLKQKAVWCATPTGYKGGIWQSGQGPASAQEGNIYLATGDGTFDANEGGLNFGDSLVRFRLEGDQIVVKDYFTPCNQAFLSRNDLDLGSTGPLLIPGTGLLLGGGKQGRLYLVDALDMGKYAVSSNARRPDCVNSHVQQEVQTTGGHIHGSPVFWQGPDASRVYVWGEMDALKSFVIQERRLQSPPTRSNYVITCDKPNEMCMPGGMLSISSNGSRPGTGIVWAVVPLNGNANKRRGVEGMVLALDAQNASRELWRSEGPNDKLGMFAKFCPPTVAGGKVFVATFGDRAGDLRQDYRDIQYYLAVYGLRPYVITIP